MIRVTILEDEPMQLQVITDFLGRYARENPDVKFNLRTFQNPLNLLDNYRCDADLLLMDIQMADMTGMEAAKRIRKIDQNVMIIFVTSLAQYSMEGYTVHAFDYILKPLHYESFSAKISLAFQMLQHKDNEEYILLKTRESAEKVPISEITYIEIARHDVLVHTLKKVIRLWGTLSSFENEPYNLSRHYFVRCNSCYLVNLRHVIGISGDYAMIGSNGDTKEKLAISGPKRREFIAALAGYQGGSI